MSLQQPPRRILLASDFSADYHIEIGPRWIELVACTLLGDTPDDRQLLDAYIVRLHHGVFFDLLPKQLGA